ncbi:MAG TPA: L-threonylcarbamoyladenylate synthase [Rhodocyclaceae bacterium]|nr:L-threonylcarbamoyladenylate synthase [Rhodocyclaceae bacterium]
MSEIQQAAELLAAGELVAMPTETVYGLAADARNPAAVAKIFAAKGRPADHPLIVHIGDIAQLEQWAREIPPAARVLAEKYWPGPLTLILKRQPDVPDAVTGGQDTVGLRMPNHPVALELLKTFALIGSGAVAAPSANKFGRISPTKASHVKNDLGVGANSAVAMILDGGESAVGIESTIVDLSRGAPVVLRPGAITAEEIEATLGAHAATPAATPAPRVSGALAAHYAPRTPLQLIADTDLLTQVHACLFKGQTIAVLAFSVPPLRHPAVLWFGAASNAPHYAHDLYANLRLLDAAGVDRILVETPPDQPEWRAVADRLGRAAVGSGADEAT